ncbi:hypothetical protein [Actinophytocola sp. KF-1]
MTDQREEKEPGLAEHVVDSLLDTVRGWIATIGGLAGGAGAGMAIWQGRAGTVPGVICLVLGVCTLVAAFFGLRDRDLGGWAGAFIAVVLGIATFVMFLVALGA